MSLGEWLVGMAAIMVGLALIGMLVYWLDKRLAPPWEDDDE